VSNAENRIEASLPAADLADVLAAFDTIKAKLPFLQDLSPEERKAMLKMGDKNLDFVTKALELASQNQDFLPRSFDVAEMKADVDLLLALVPVMTRLQPLYDLIDDTYMLVGSEAYAAALEVYRYAKQAHLGDGLDPLLGAMGKKFARKTAAADPEPKPVVTA
jgi:hypothetical protein